ncbi:Propanediol utilization protein PduA [compost metagenome]
MKQQALGLIETIGFTTAVSAADAALKTADVTIEAVEKVIGVGGKLGVTIHFSGDVAAVSSGVEAGRLEGERIGKVVSAHVIPRAHNDVIEKILSHFSATPLDEPLEAEEPSEEKQPIEEISSGPEKSAPAKEAKKRPTTPNHTDPLKPE